MIWGNSDPRHPFLVCTGGSKMAVFEVKIRSQWQGHPGTLESKWKLFNASNHIYINRKTWFGATLTPAILLLCAQGIKNGRFWGQNQVTMAGSPFLPGHEWRGQNMIDFRPQWQGHLATLESLWTLYTPQIKSINRNTCFRSAIVMQIPLVSDSQYKKDGQLKYYSNS